MKIARLIIGVISLLLCVIITLQSCGAGIVNAFLSTGGSDGTAGLFLVFCWIIGAIILICTRKGGIGPPIAGMFYIIGGMVAIANAGIFMDLYVWAILGYLVSVFLSVTSIVEEVIRFSK